MFCHNFDSLVYKVVFIHSIGEVGNNNNFHATLSRILDAKFDGNLLTTFKVIVKKPLAYFLWTRCILQKSKWSLQKTEIEQKSNQTS